MTTIGPKQPDSSSSPIPPREELPFPAEGRPELPKGAGRQVDKDMGVAQTRADTGIQIKKKDKILAQADTMTRVSNEDVKRKIIAGESTKTADVPTIPAPKTSAGEGSNADAVRSWYKDSSIAQISNAMAPILDTYKESKKMAGQAAIEQAKQIQLMQTKEMPEKTRAAANQEAVKKFTEAMSNFMNAASSVYTAVETTSNIGAAGREVDAEINAKAEEVNNVVNPGANVVGGGMDEAAVPGANLPRPSNEMLAAEVPGEAEHIANARKSLRQLMDSRSTLVSNKITNLNQVTNAQGQALSGAINGVSNTIQGVLQGQIGIIEAEKQVIDGYRNAFETFKQNSSKVESEQADAIKGLLDFMSRFVEQTGRSIQSRA